MGRSKLISLLLMLACQQAWSASVVYIYKQNGDVEGISAITGISQESSWRCKNDDAILCSCPSALFEGVIARVDYSEGDSVVEGFVLETDESAIHVNLGTGWGSDLGTADSSWIPKLLHRGESVIVIAERCGVSGRNVVARDIFKNKLIKKMSINPAAKKYAKPRVRSVD